MTRVPKLLTGCDIKSLPLTPADGFLLSRVDATTNEHDLALVTGFTAEQVAAMLDRLASLGAIAFSGGGASHTERQTAAQPVASVSGVPDARRTAPDGRRTAPDARRTAPAPRRTAPIRPAGGPAELEEDAELQRRRALAHKLSGTYPMVMARTPDPATDPHASEALVAEYDQTANEVRLTQLADSLEQGKNALARKDFDGAIKAHRLASSLAADDPRVQAICDEAIRHAARALADGYWQQAVQEEREGLWEEAALSYSKVCVGRPGDALAHERVANAALRSGNVRRAVEFARKAIELAPGTAIYRITLARAYAAAGLEKSSHSELERALGLAPDDARIQNLVSRVRSLVASTAGRAG